MRLIDVNELEKILIPEDASGGFWGYGTLKAILDQQPTVDTERHGKWEEYEVPHIICCSECDWGTGVDEKHFKYCPNCGAKF